MAKKKSPGRKKKRGPKKASVTELKNEIKNLKAQLAQYEESDTEPLFPVGGPKPSYTEEAFAVRIDNKGNYVLDKVGYNYDNENVETKILCEGSDKQYFHAEFELKKMLARGELVPKREK